MYTVLLAATPSVTLADPPLVIVGDTSVTVMATAWVVLSVPSEALTTTS